jgi:ABC-type branched-subunit amino acid transport system substrate-binding protein
MASSGVPDIGEAITAARFNLPNNFSPQPNPPGWTTGPFIYLASKYGSAVTSKMAILADDQPTAQQEASNIQAAMESVGYKFIYSETNVQPTQTDFSAEIATMQSMGVQGIVNFGSGGQMGAMAAQMEQAGWSVPLNTWNPSAYDPAFLATAGSGANGSILEQSTALFQGQDASVIPEVALFDKWYHAVAGASAVPNTYAIYGWLSGMLFVQSLNAGGAPTRTALLTGLRTITSFNGNGIEAESNPAGKQAPTCWILIDVKNSQFVRDPVDPTSGFLCSPSGYYSIK